MVFSSSDTRNVQFLQLTHQLHAWFVWAERERERKLCSTKIDSTSIHIRTLVSVTVMTDKSSKKEETRGRKIYSELPIRAHSSLLHVKT